MDRASSKWKIILGLIIFTAVLSASYSLIKKDEYCPVIDDLRDVDTIKIVNAFNHSQIHYFVDLQHSYQILAVKWQVEEAYSVLNNLGIKVRSEHQSSCKIVH